MEVQRNLFDCLRIDDVATIGRCITGEPEDNDYPRLDDTGSLLFQPSVFTRALHVLRPRIYASPHWKAKEGLLTAKLCEGVSLKQSFATARSADATNTFDSWSCFEKVFVEIADAPNQNITKLGIDDNVSISFELSYGQTGPLPLKFTNYHVKGCHFNNRVHWLFLARN